MSRHKFEIDTIAFSEEVINSDFMFDHIKSIADEIAAKAGEGYAAETTHGRKRVIAQVRTETFKAMRDNNQNNTLLKAAAPLKVKK